MPAYLYRTYKIVHEEDFYPWHSEFIITYSIIANAGRL